MHRKFIKFSLSLLVALPATVQSEFITIGWPWDPNPKEFAEPGEKIKSHEHDDSQQKNSKCGAADCGIGGHNQEANSDEDDSES